MLSCPIQLSSLFQKNFIDNKCLTFVRYQVFIKTPTNSFPIRLLGGLGKFSIFWPLPSFVRSFMNMLMRIAIQYGMTQEKRGDLGCTRCWYRDWYRTTTTAEKEKSFSRSTNLVLILASSFHISFITLSLESLLARASARVGVCRDIHDGKLIPGRGVF